LSDATSLKTPPFYEFNASSDFQICNSLHIFRCHAASLSRPDAHPLVFILADFAVSCKPFRAKWKFTHSLLQLLAFPAII
jgi:hypothetical protein